MGEEGSSVGNLNAFWGLRGSYSEESDNGPQMGHAEVASVTRDSALVSYCGPGAHFISLSCQHMWRTGLGAGMRR